MPVPDVIDTLELRKKVGRADKISKLRPFSPTKPDEAKKNTYPELTEFGGISHSALCE